MEILDGGRRAEVRGNADPVVLAIDFPEGAMPRTDEVGLAAVLFRWSNWCGGPARVRWLDGADPDSGLQPRQPGCQSDARPSVLRRFR